ncbi:hypothetical protein [Gemmobacter serpentinus]|uniref:hypothetical protein n=1 Tax=Gemmobacter serpentinus TaxID=2652247 RepID=UPI00124BF950|nr:hypothetical protein [Gemmobacter serpentinus]
MAGITISNSKGVTFGRVELSHRDVGIMSTNSDVHIKSGNFKEVARPYLAQGGTLRSENSDASQFPQPHEHVHQAAHRRKTTVPPIPVKCGQCGSISSSRQFSVHNANFYSCRNKETCIVCGADDAEVATGLFQSAIETVKLLSGPSDSIDQMRSLRILLDGVSSGETSIQEAVDSADKIKPGLKIKLATLALYGASAFGLLSQIAGAYADVPQMVKDIQVFAAEVLAEQIIVEQLFKETPR